MRRPKQSHPKGRRRSTIEDFLALPDAEKEAVYQSVDREFSPAEMQPLTPAERRKWDRVQRELNRTHRPPRVISIRVAPELLEKSDAYAKRLGMTRSELIAKGLQAVLAKAG